MQAASCVHRERQRVRSVDAHAQRAQGIDDGGHRPASGTIVAVEVDVAGGQRRDNRHEPHHRASKAHIDRGGSA